MARFEIDLTAAASALHVHAGEDVREGDLICVRLTGIPSSGYEWYPAALPVGVDHVSTDIDAAVVVVPDDVVLAGGSATWSLLFTVGDTPGGDIQLRCVRPHNRHAEPSRTCTVTVTRV